MDAAQPRLAIATQEALVIDDLLYLLMGIEGKYIECCRHPFPLARLNPKEPLDPAMVSMQTACTFFKIHPGFDPTLDVFARRFLPLVACYFVVDSFASTYSAYEFGIVFHALAAALCSLLKEFHMLVVQLEREFRASPDFSLQRFWFHVQKSAATLALAAEICVSLHNAYASGPKTLLSRRRSSATADMVSPASVAFANANGHQSQFAPGRAHSALPRTPLLMHTSLSLIRPSSERKTEWHPRGGGVVGVLSQRYVACCGDPESKGLLTFLLSSTSRPLLQILRTWIHRGKLDDPLDEFFIIENTLLVKNGLTENYSDRYWDGRYTVREAAVPPFLAPFVKKIVLTGKYLNAYMECDGGSISASAQRVHNSSRTETATTRVAHGGSREEGQPTCDRSVLGDLADLVDGGAEYIAEIDGAYRLANRLLLDSLMGSHQLTARLQSFKAFFLFEKSDYLDDFLDLADVELDKLSHQVSTAKLQSLFEMATSNPASSAFRDPFRDEIKIELASREFFETLLGISSVSALSACESAGKPHAVRRGNRCLVLQYKADFPLSLFFSKRSITKYQLLFGLLLTVRQSERRLCISWRQQSKQHLRFRKAKNGGALSVAFGPIATRLSQLRMRMLALLQSLGGYLAHDVVEGHHAELVRQMQAAQTVDEILEFMQQFLGSCLKDTMLTNGSLVRIYMALLKHTEDFCALFDDFSRIAHEATGGIGSAVPDASPVAAACSVVGFNRTLTRIEKEWTQDTRQLLDLLRRLAGSESSLYLVLVNRLDFSAFYG